MYACCTSKKKKIDLMIQNPELLRLRLSPQEKYYYTNLFYEHSINEKVPRHKFPVLLGLLGTDIAENFALRIFDTFSADKKNIRLNEYLKYVDVYHYGDEIERCRVTFQLMDKTRDNEIDLAEFGEYINLLIAAIRKVHPQSTENLFSQKDIKDLFNKIVNNNKTTFSYQDFEKVYMEKPDLLSWIDYFKNNDEEVLFLINHNLKGLLFTLQTFFERFSKLMHETHSTSGMINNSFEKDFKLFDLSPAINEIDRFCKAIEKRRKVFVNSAGRFNIRTIFEKLTKSFNDTMNINRDHSPGAPKTTQFPIRNSMNKFDFNLTKMSTNNNFNNLLMKSGVENINSNDIMIEEQVDNLVKEPDSRLFNNTVDLNSRENDKTYLPMFLRNLNSETIKNQFKNIKDNINEVHIPNPSNKIDEENLDDDNEEGPISDKDTVVKYGINRFKVNLDFLKRQGNSKEKEYRTSLIRKSRDMNSTHNNKKFSTTLNYKKSLNIYLDENEKIEYDLKENNQNEDISKIDDIINQFPINQNTLRNNTEVLLFDDTNLMNFSKYKESNDTNNSQINAEDINIKIKNEDGNLNDKNLLLKFNSAPKGVNLENQNLQLSNSPEKIDNEGTEENFQKDKSKKRQSTQKSIQPISNLNLKNLHVNVNFNNVKNVNLNLNNLRKHVSKIRKNDDSNVIKLNILEEEKQLSIEEHNKSLIVFFKKMKKLSDTSCQMVKWIEQSYKWVENRYLRDQLKKNQKDKFKDPALKGNNNDVRFSVQNIPKTKPVLSKNKSDKKSKSNSKNKSNLLKATDDNFKILLNVVMGIQVAVQSTPNLRISGSDDLSNYLNSLVYSIQTTNFGSKRQETFYIKEYAGILFNNIRKLYDIDKDTFISSISPQDFITGIIISGSTIIEELCSTGKSGSLFYYTRDGKYILKTISTTEYNFFKKILPNYFQHLHNNKYTLMPKFFGCFKLVRKVKKHKSRVHFVIMQNIFSTNKEIHLRYDLKGSKIGRQVIKENEKEKFKGLNKLSYALKDLDLEMNKHVFFVGEKKDKIMDQLKRDTQFLQENNIIDYSLLIGIHILDIENNKEKNILETKPEKFLRTSSPLRMFKPSSRKQSMYTSPFKKYNSEDPKETRSLSEKKNFNLDLDDDEKFNNSDFSEYDRNINFSENESIEHDNLKNNIEEFDIDKNLHPYRDFDDGGIKSSTNKEVYFLGIIDILTQYNCAKKIEYASKLIYYCSDKMSCIPPVPYRNRFDEYMKNKFVEIETPVLSEHKDVDYKLDKN